MGGNHGALPVDLDQDLVRTCAHAPLASCLVVNSTSPARLAVTWLSPRQIVQTNQSRWQPYYNVEGGGGGRVLRIELRVLVQIHRKRMLSWDGIHIVLEPPAGGPIPDSLAVDPDQWVLGLPVTTIHAP